MTQTDLETLAKNTAAAVGIDPALVCAVIEQESNWNTWAMRFEPMFLAHYVKPALPEAPTTRELARATSWGLLQIMGEVAIEFGWLGPYLSALCDPEQGILWGCKKLKKCIDSRPDLRSALLAYNGGGHLNYPDQVIARMANYA